MEGKVSYNYGVRGGTKMPQPAPTKLSRNEARIWWETNSDASRGISSASAVTKSVLLPPMPSGARWSMALIVLGQSIHAEWTSRSAGLQIILQFTG